MARLPRFAIPGQPQHVIQRGNNRQAIFRAEADYSFFLEKLSEAANKHQCDIPETTLTAIRESTNKAWALGDHRFKAKVAKQSDRPLQSSGHGGDRKSKEFYSSLVRLGSSWQKG